MFGGIRHVPLGHVQLTSISPAVGLGTLPKGANACVFNADTQNVRWRDDGVAPTAAIGMLCKTTDPPVEYIGSLALLQFIQTTGGAILNVALYRLTG